MKPITIQLTDQQIPLYIDSEGDSAVGIGRERIIVIVEKSYVQPESESHPTENDTNNSAREQVRADFSAIAAEYFETGVNQAHFIDECVDCGKLLGEDGKCHSKFCVGNYEND